jgi:hypothetical protein
MNPLTLFANECLQTQGIHCLFFELFDLAKVPIFGERTHFTL